MRLFKKQIVSLLAVLLVISLTFGSVTAGAALAETAPSEAGFASEGAQSEFTKEETNEETKEETAEVSTEEESEESTGETGETKEETEESTEEGTGESAGETGESAEDSKEGKTEESEEESAEEGTEEESTEEQLAQYAVADPSEWLSYNMYLGGEGWQAADAKNGATSGRENSGVNVEALRLVLNQKQYSASGVRYRVHMQSFGWLDYTSNNDCGKIGSGKRMEAVQITLSGSIASAYDIYYRVYVQDLGWLGWAKNGAEAGSQGLSKRLEAIQVKMVAKGGAAPGPTSDPFVTKGDSAGASAYPNTHVNTGNKKEDIIAIAETQIGYSIDGAGRTKYGSWYGNYINGNESFYSSAAWCAMFVSWCADQAGISSDGFRYHSYTPTMKTWYENKGRWHEKGSYTPKRGDLIFFKYSGGNNNPVNHVGIVTGASGGYVETIEGNNRDAVRTGRYALSMPEIVGYAVPDYSSFGDEDTEEGKLIGYTSYVEGKQWGGMKYDGAESGTVGSSLRLQALRAELKNAPVSGGVSYRVHMQTYGWLDWVKDGAVCGVTDELKRMEALQIVLTGEMAKQYDIYYRAHVQSYGWLDWAKNGESAGSEGYSKRVEAIQILLVAKGGKAPGNTKEPFKVRLEPVYQTHVQTYGWQDWVRSGEISGTYGESKRLEGIKIKLDNHSATQGGITYSTHVQTYGWQDWVQNGEVSGTSGKSKRLEAIKIELTGALASQYDVYYRVHAQTYGWLGWAKNGEEAGTEGLSRRLEAIEIVLIPKGKAAPGSSDRHFIKR